MGNWIRTNDRSLCRKFVERETSRYYGKLRIWEQIENWTFIMSLEEKGSKFLRFYRLSIPFYILLIIMNFEFSSVDIVQSRPDNLRFTAGWSLIFSLVNWNLHIFYWAIILPGHCECCSRWVAIRKNGKFLKFQNVLDSIAISDITDQHSVVQYIRNYSIVCFRFSLISSVVCTHSRLNSTIIFFSPSHWTFCDFSSLIINSKSTHEIVKSKMK